VKRVLEAKAVKPDENAMYLYTNFLEMIWPYDDRGRLIGEDVWEPDPDKAETLGCEILHRQGEAAGANCSSVQGWIEIEIRSHTRNAERNCG
jgi:hypothetical protein